MKTLTRTEAADFLAAHDHYIILTHNRPDGDTVGSAAALCLGLRSLGKTAHVLENPGVTPRYQKFHQGLTVDAVDPADCVVSVDVASPEMLHPDFRFLLGRVALRVDHHSDATSFADYELVDPASASCAEIIYDILLELGCRLDRDMAEAVYVGISTDTGCFRFSNTTAHTFTTAAACAQAGARIYELNTELFETNTLARLRMQAWMVKNMKMLRGGTMAICAIPLQVEKEEGVTGDDMDNISNFPRTIAGVQVAATLRETEAGEVRLSVRAVPGYDAAQVTLPFGGGGHKGAAGGTIKMPLAQAAQAVERVMLELAP